MPELVCDGGKARVVGGNIFPKESQTVGRLQRSKRISLDVKARRPIAPACCHEDPGAAKGRPPALKE